MKFQRFATGVVGVVLTVTFIAAELPVTSSYAEETGAEFSVVEATEAVSEKAVQERLDLINSKYEVGELFNDEDEAFVKTYASQVNAVASAAADTSSFEKTVSKYGTTVKAKGTIFHKGFGSYTYGGDVSVKKIKGKTPKKYKVTISCTAYGVIGSQGVGIIYNGSTSASKKNSDTFKTSLSEGYIGAQVAWSVSCKVRVRTAAGDVFVISE